MKILIIGEYSGFIKNLTYGFKNYNDVEVVVFAQADGYKTIKQDVKCYSYAEYDNFKLFGVQIRKSYLLRGIIPFLKFKRDIKKYKNYFDVVFIVNAEFLRPNWYLFKPLFSSKDLDYVKKNNAKVFLSACGFDYANIQYMKYNAPQVAYHILNNYDNTFYNLQNKIAYKCSDGIIPVAYLYAQSYRDYKSDIKLLNSIPLPFNATTIPYQDNIKNSKIRIFNGVLRQWKGSKFTEEALSIIQEKYGDRVEIVFYRKPYDEFIKSLSDINIYIDQCGNSYGVAALVAMSAGCVTFSGDSIENSHELRVVDSPIIPMSYDVPSIVEKISWWVEHPEEFLKRGAESRAYVERYHNPDLIAKLYMEIFNS